jgi:hypothetical protein
MEAATARGGIRADYAEMTLRTRGRGHSAFGCHTPGCRERAADGKRFCSGCQATLDRVRAELKAAKPGRRGRALRKA